MLSEINLALRSQLEVGNRSKQFNDASIAGLITGQLNQNILIIIQPERRADGESHLVLINVNTFAGCIMTRIIRECLRGDNCYSAICSTCDLIYNRSESGQGSAGYLIIDLDRFEISAFEGDRVRRNDDRNIDRTGLICIIDLLDNRSSNLSGCQ